VGNKTVRLRSGVRDEGHIIILYSSCSSRDDLILLTPPSFRLHQIWFEYLCAAFVSIISTAGQKRLVEVAFAREAHTHHLIEEVGSLGEVVRDVRRRISEILIDCGTPPPPPLRRDRPTCRRHRTSTRFTSLTSTVPPERIFPPTLSGPFLNRQCKSQARGTSKIDPSSSTSLLDGEAERSLFAARVRAPPSSLHLLPSISSSFPPSPLLLLLTTPLTPSSYTIAVQLFFIRLCIRLSTIPPPVA
jgi:hypothetical protein